MPRLGKRCPLLASIQSRAFPLLAHLVLCAMKQPLQRGKELSNELCELLPRARGEEGPQQSTFLQVTPHKLCQQASICPWTLQASCGVHHCEPTSVSLLRPSAASASVSEEGEVCSQTTPLPPLPSGLFLFNKACASTATRGQCLCGKSSELSSSYF